MSADYLVMCIMLFAVLFNRHAIIFFLLCFISELPFFLPTSPVYDTAFMATLFSLVVFTVDRIKFELQMAISWYAIMFWLSSLDYWLTDTRTYFYVIFPYVIKFIDIYVIYHLIHKEQGSDRFNSAPFGSFN